MKDITKYLELFKNKSILVLGDLMVDEYQWCKTRKISQEAPVPVVNLYNTELRLGGAGNVINNIRSLGGNVTAVGTIGSDIEGDWIMDELERIGADSMGVFVDYNKPTIKKTRIIAGTQQIVRIDREDTKCISPDLVDEMFKFMTDNIEEWDAILISDYAKGTILNYLAINTIGWANANNKLVIVDPKGKDFSRYFNASVLTPNSEEVKEAYGSGDIYNLGYKIFNDLKLSHGLLVTLGKDGAWAFTEHNQKIIKTDAKKVADVSGAGDTMIAALTLAMSCGMDIYDASKFANMAAGISVGKLGTSTVTPDEILSNVNSLISNGKLRSRKDIINTVKDHRTVDKKIAFTNGCFDLLHVGHIKLLEEAKSFADILVVGINSDKSIRRLKGRDRPFVIQEERAKILSALEYVDYVVIFDEDTPSLLIESIKPDILVKGSDYIISDIAGSNFVIENGGSVKLVELLEHKSTSNIINLVKKEGEIR